MRVLILSQYYFPEPVEKIHDLARGLVALGHSVQVLTGFPCYPLGRIFDGYRQRPWMEESIEGVRVIRVPQLPDHSERAWKRGLYYASFAVSATAFGPARLEAADVMLVYQAALPIGFAAWAIGRLRRIPIVLDVVDLWPESVLASGISRSQTLARFLRRAARWVYDKADHISVVTEGFRQNLRDLGVPDRKLGVIHNWMPSGTYRPQSPDPAVAEREGLSGRFNIIYAGNMGTVQALDTVLDAAARLDDLPDVQFVLVGGGTEQPRLKEAALARGLTNVRFLGRRDPETMPSLYAHAAALLVHLRPDPLSDVTIPSKLFAYLACARPVLVGVRGDAEAFLRRGGFGLSFAPADPEAMADAVRSLYRMSPAARAGLGQAAVRFHRDECSSDVQTRRFESVLARVASLHRPVDSDARQRRTPLA